MLWWDTKKLSEPVDTLILDTEKKGRLDHALGAMTLEYEPTIVSDRRTCRVVELTGVRVAADEIHGWYGARTHHLV